MAAMNPSQRRRLGRILRIAFGMAGIAFLAIAFADTWNRSRHSVLPSPGALLGAGGLLIASLILASRGWIGLFEGPFSRPELIRGFYTAQLGRYIPGAVWQAVGQVGLAGRAGVSARRASAAFPVFALGQAAAGGTVAALLAGLGSGLSPGLRLGSLAGLLLVLPLWRAWMVKVVGLAGRLLGKPALEELIPSQRRILRCYAWAVATLLAASSGFALLASSLDLPTSSGWAMIPAFSLAWTVGFLAVPFPSGLGIREAVLVTVIGRPGAAALIAASVAHRLLNMLAEFLMIAVSRIRGEDGRLEAPQAKTPSPGDIEDRP